MTFELHESCNIADDDCIRRNLPGGSRSGSCCLQKGRRVIFNAVGNERDFAAVDLVFLREHVLYNIRNGNKMCDAELVPQPMCNVMLNGMCAVNAGDVFCICEHCPKCCTRSVIICVAVNDVDGARADFFP